MAWDICGTDCVHEEAVERAKEAELTWQEYEDIALLHKMMADHTRLRVLRSLQSGEMCVCDIAVTLGMSKSAVSHHLKALRLTRLVSARRDGKSVYYTLSDDHVGELMQVSLEHVREA